MLYEYEYKIERIGSGFVGSTTLVALLLGIMGGGAVIKKYPLSRCSLSPTFPRAVSCAIDILQKSASKKVHISLNV